MSYDLSITVKEMEVLKELVALGLDSYRDTQRDLMKGEMRTAITQDLEPKDVQDMVTKFADGIMAAEVVHDLIMSMGD